ncbi:Uu.00g014710.m01.CDS01 [Anthostomella pinea]|uniref:Uu.00g014710.m01.CDS01 n=1 Tax=Anthostomella pinea TaxID=933095 RepID=A0AAI8YN42_9PEZI|nr:Uu.00g014710.m01.CDS01 [Anthostomella pinea]
MDSRLGVGSSCAEGLAIDGSSSRQGPVHPHVEQDEITFDTSSGGSGDSSDVSMSDSDSDAADSHDHVRSATLTRDTGLTSPSAPLAPGVTASASFQPGLKKRKSPLPMGAASFTAEPVKKEIDLLLSSSVPSLLMPALPFVLVTDSTHVIPSAMLQDGQATHVLQLTKIFLSEHIEKLRREFLSVKAMGTATTEEWLKGLEDRGKEQQSDSVRWEKWESSGGTRQMRNLSSPGGPSSTSTGFGSMPSDSSVSIGSLQTTVVGTEPRQHVPGLAKSNAILSAPRNMTISSAYPPREEPMSLPHSSLQAVPQPNPPRNRTREEVLELKAARRVEIERRAMGLVPPLQANVLARIPSFHAALQIPFPLDDNAWDLLKPRLLAQRADAEQREQQDEEVAALSRIAQQRVEERRNAKGTSLETKQLIDKGWDDIQVPLRAQISAYADEIIRDGWRDGRKVNKSSAVQFAAEVLLYVRKRFYAEIAKDVASLLAAGQEPVFDAPEGPFTRILTLENMKWLFDVKVKPITDPYRKELFYCNGCEGNMKMYGFEGVVQHYAAKHTSTLSLGSVVVHWRAEWPEIPPFHPDPRSLKNSNISQFEHFHKTSTPQNGAVLHQPSHAAFPPSTEPGSYHPSYYNPPPPGFGPPGYGDPYAPSPSQAAYGPSAPYAPVQHAYGQPCPPQQGSGYSGVPAPYAGTFATGQPSYNPTRGNHYAHSYNTHAVPFADKYRTQLEDVARNSRELWTATANLKELPGNIRVSVVIHHVVGKFRSRFSENPPLNLFIDGLSNNKEMRPVRNVNGLMCKACSLGLDNAMLTDQDRKTFSLPQLVNHFNQRHVQQLLSYAPTLDWTVDMIYLPDLSALSNLRNLTNMDSQRFALVSDAFPPAKYPGGYSLTVSAAPQVPSGNYLAYHNLSANVQDSLINQPPEPPSHQAAPSHSRPQHISSQQLASGYDPKAPSMQLDFSRKACLAHENIEALQTSANHKTPSTTSHPGGSGRTSPDTRQSSHGAKSRNRKGGARDSKITSAQGSKHRNGNGNMATTGPEIREPSEEDTGAEEEARRQEDEIRAMWAADRRETARLVSTNQVPKRGTEPMPHVAATAKHDLQRSPELEAIERPQSQAQVHRDNDQQQPFFIQERDNDDLMAGLESHLDRQASDYRPGPVGGTVSERVPFYTQPSSPRRQEYTNEQTRSQSPIYIRYESGPHLEAYRERSAGIRGSTHGSGAAPVAVDGVYENPPHRQYQPRPYHGRQASTQYIEAYELVPVRDSQGEYYIRRPIRRAQEPAYVAYEDELPIHRDQFIPYEEEAYYRRQPVYGDSALRSEPPMRQPVYDDASRLAGTVGQQGYETFSRNDPASYEECDPRFPAAPASSDIDRQVRY